MSRFQDGVRCEIMELSFLWACCAGRDGILNVEYMCNGKRVWTSGALVVWLRVLTRSSLRSMHRMR